MNALFLSFVSDNWRKFLFPIAAIAVFIAFLLIPRGQAGNSASILSEQNPFPELIEKDVEDIIEEVSEVSAISNIIIIDVKGAVRHPGVYTLEEGDRLIDAINAAGGYVPDADSRLLNHALKLHDEFLIYVPLVGEDISERELIGGPNGGTARDDGIVNINTADESELMSISGVGPAKAAAIIQYREEHGAYNSPQEITNVSGIGQKTFEKLQHQIKVK